MTSTSWEGFHGSVAGRDRDGPEPASSRRATSPSRASTSGPPWRSTCPAYDKDEPAAFGVGTGADEGGVATAVWAPPRPTFDVATDLPDQDEYEVRVYDTKRHRRLVAAVEIVSPGNKDRPENRRAFVTKCAALLQQRVSVAIVDLVTTRQFNLYGDLLELIGQADPALAPEPPPLYAAACRWTHRTRPGISRPGTIPSPSASRCRRCRCGWPTTSPCPSSWKRATRRPAASSAWREPWEAAQRAN